MSIYTDSINSQIVNFSTSSCASIVWNGGQLDLNAKETIKLVGNTITVYGEHGQFAQLGRSSFLKDANNKILIDDGIWQLNAESSADNKEIVIGPEPDSNSNIVSIELDGSHFGQFNVTSISLLARNTQNLPTTSQLWLSIWKQVSGENYSLLAVSKEAKAQVWGEWTKWEFDNVELTGGRIRIAALETPETPFANASQIGIQCQQVGVDDSCLLHGPKQAINYHPAMIIRSDDDAKYAPLSHVTDEDRHLSTVDRNKLNAASTNAQAALNNTTTLAANLAQEKNDALQHLYWHHSGNYTALAALMGPNGAQYFPEALHVTQAEKDKWNSATGNGGCTSADVGNILGGRADSDSVAGGSSSNAFTNSTSVGWYAKSACYSVAVGRDACASDYSVANGWNTSAFSYATVIGYYSMAGRRAASIGAYSRADGCCSICLGSCTSTDGTYEIVIGAHSHARSTNTVIIGACISVSNINTVSIGYKARACCESAIAIGREARAGAVNSIAIGQSAVVCSGSSGIAIGYRASASGADSLAIGDDSFASRTSSVAVGVGARAAEHYTTVIGQAACASDIYAIALGYGSSAVSCASVALGSRANANSAHTVAVGQHASASTTGAIAIGYYAQSSCSFAIASGWHAKAEGGYSIAIGACASTSADSHYSFAIGRACKVYSAGEGAFSVSSTGGTYTVFKIVASGNEVSNSKLGGAAGLGYKEKSEDYRYIKLKDFFDLVERAQDILNLLK